MDIRTNNRQEKQVLVKWEGFSRPTWQPYSHIQQQLPELMTVLENKLLNQHQHDSKDEDKQDDHDHEEIVVNFVTAYIAQNNITCDFRWAAHQMNSLENASIIHNPPIKETTIQLKRRIMAIVAGSWMA